MLLTRLWMGALLIILAILILFEERWFAPWFPFLFTSVLLAVLLGTRELLQMLPEEKRPVPWICLGTVGILTIANWYRPILSSLAPSVTCIIDPWHLLGGITLLGMLIAFLREMVLFIEPTQNTERLALTMLIIGYLGILPSFLIQLRWTEHAVAAIALTVFVPKCGDIGAYFTGKFLTGRLLGRNLMTPHLSPKKTWQGAIGGLLTSTIVSVAFQASMDVLPGSWLVAIGFGITVGIAGQVGDLAESLIKRDCQIKDASRSIPGFGGVLDVIDSMLFAAPVAYLWLQ